MIEAAPTITNVGPGRRARLASPLVGLVAVVACSAPSAPGSELAPPVQLEVHELGGAVRLRWSEGPGGGAAGYRVFQADAEPASFVHVQDVTDTTAYVDGLENEVMR